MATAAFGPDEAVVDQVLDHLPGIIQRLRDLSPFSEEHRPVDPASA